LYRQIKIAARLIILFAVLVAAAFVSFKLRTVTNSLLLYLPSALSIVLVHWIGLRILPIIYLNGIVTLLIWSAVGSPLRIALLATHEPVVAFVSWFLVNKVLHLKNIAPLHSTDSFLRFVILGVVIPTTVNSMYVYHYSFVNGDMAQVFLIWLSDFITILPISLPLLYFFRYDADTLSIRRRSTTNPITRQGWIEIALSAFVFITLSFVFPFDRYWFIYGIGSTLVALRRGFETALVLNVIIFLLSYLLPLFDFASSLLISHGSTQFINVHLGMSTMMFISVLVGRVFSDLTNSEDEVRTQKEEVENYNKQLSQVNRELDRFVYSVSHDLSAPLKSIKGLVIISRMEPEAAMEYLDKIEISVNRLESFIDEVLDYSRTNRRDLILEDVNLKQLVTEINEKFQFLEGYEKIWFTYNFQNDVVRTDKFLMRVVLSNLLSNAIKYQKTKDDHQPEIRLRSYTERNYFIIEVADNGEGIPENYQEKIFDMFYRGTVNSTGSGLGLYIAREAVHKMKGEISVQSDKHTGSVFKIHLRMDQSS
jgi:two-component system, sensor histidine kinase